MGGGASKTSVQPEAKTVPVQPQVKTVPVRSIPETIPEESEPNLNGEPDDSLPKQSESDLPRSTFSGHRSVTSQASSSDERAELLKQLEHEARKIMSQPPGAIVNSQSYSFGYEHYKTRCKARTEEELKKWFKQEKSMLQQETVDFMIKAKFENPDNYKVTRQNQLSEYKLRLSSLVNQYLEINSFFENEKMLSEQEKNEDLLFFGTMLERVKNGATRPDVLTSVDNYSAECRQKMSSSSGRSVSSWKSYGSSVYPRPLNGYPRQQPQTPIPRAQLDEEASDVLTVGSKNAQKAANVRRIERETLKNELNSRASSVQPVTYM